MSNEHRQRLQHQHQHQHQQQQHQQQHEQQQPRWWRWRWQPHQQTWLFIVLCLWLEAIQESCGTPVAKMGRGRVPCAHETIAELIKTSPIILKGLGAHIFTNDELTVLQSGKDTLAKWPTVYNNILTSSTIDAGRSAASEIKAKMQLSSKADTWSLLSKSPLSPSPPPPKSRRRSSADRSSKSSDHSAERTMLNGATAISSDTILITLTPETVYKGASLLKTTPAGQHSARSGSTSNGSGSGSGSSGSSSSSSNVVGNGNANSPESSYQYEGQLNATLQPLACFDENLLEMLPTELIIFAKLITGQQQQEEEKKQQQQQQYLAPTAAAGEGVGARGEEPAQKADILRISINGLHRWSRQFEDYIWKHLGWDDWSDFTVCSVTCGKGVQQRFRRCLLDNPMVNLKHMSFNVLHATGDDDVDVMDDDFETVVGSADVNEGAIVVAQHVNIGNNSIKRSIDNINVVSDGKVEKTDRALAQQSNARVYGNGGGFPTDSRHLEKAEVATGNLFHSSSTQSTRTTTTTTTSPNEPTSDMASDDNSTELNDTRQARNDGNDNGNEDGDGHDDRGRRAEPEIIRIFEGSPAEKDQADNRRSNVAHLKSKKNSKESTKGKSKESAKGNSKKNSKEDKKKKHKSAKSFSTMFCEGYNIEQRNCNTFECSDDISDLLKYYRKFPITEDTSSASSLQPDVAMTNGQNGSPSTAPAQTPPVSSSSLYQAPVDLETSTGDAGNTANATSSTTTPANMGFVHSWHNILNFTLMLTLRIKNDTSSGSATIFSIRNSTHNLYLESCRDGLRLYLERDKTTEMLPIKFNLYDGRWHQVAISIQNGDFISIYVDCSWTNSFVVSKRLFSLPLNADIEIGRSFKGEMQQLLVLPDNQERHQCSNKRTSINEVKRYIIDTFIDDYSN